MVRFKFKKFKIDKTWKTQFTEEALNYLKNNKEQLYVKLNYAVNGEHNEEGLECIICLDQGDAESKLDAEHNKLNPSTTNVLNIKSVLVFSDNKLFFNYNIMFFGSNVIAGAAQSLQSDNSALKEIANAVVKGDKAEYDDNILFPYSVLAWRASDKDKKESYF